MILSVLLIAAVSCRWPVKPSSVAVKATTTDLSPVSAQDILGFNNILQLAVAPADYIISKEIKAASLDPIKKGIAGSAQKEQNLGICKANVGINYSIDNIKGLSTAALDRIDIKSAEKRLDGAFKLDLEAQIKPFDLAGEISGRLDARCGIVKPHIDINGDLVAERVSLGLILEATAYPLPNKEWYINATITNVTTDFKDVVIHLHGFNTIFNPLLDFVLRAVENSFRDKIESTLDVQIKDKVNLLLQAQLDKLAKAWASSLGLFA